MDSDDLQRLIFGPEPVQEDVDRWLLEGFAFSSAIAWGLRQHQGGPCAVLAPVQGFILADLLVQDLMPDPSPEECRMALTQALARILWRARPDDPDATASWDGRSCSTIEALRTTIASVKLDVPGAVMTFVRSLIQTRTVDGIRTDLSYDSDPLVSRFGHGTQELVNLCLFGRAVSHLFDGKRLLAPNVEICGVPARGPVGVLSELEVLQYQKVGNWCRYPELPIWVIASSTHYTVLFSMDVQVGKLSEADVLEHRAYAEFARYDQTDSGFIAVTDLAGVLSNLGHADLATGPIFDEFKFRVDPEGTGVVVWQSLWNALQSKPTRDQPWPCSACTFINEGVADECEMCLTRRPTTTADAPVSHAKQQAAPEFVLYHYNGIENHQGAQVQCTEVAVQVIDAEGIPQGLSAGRGLREIVQTRWPDAIVDFPAGVEPRIT